VTKSVVGNRKPTELSSLLNRNLSRYTLTASAAAVSLLAARRAEAQIVYTPANESIYGPHQKLSLDLNHDGLPDLIISELPFHSGSIFAGNSVRALPHGGEESKTDLVMDVRGHGSRLADRTKRVLSS